MSIVVLDAPTNLGLRPPAPGTVPGCAKAPGALRDHDLLGRLGARDAGHVVAPRYDRGDWSDGDGVFHAAEIARYASRLADRIEAALNAGDFPVVLGGDCSLLLGPAIASHRREGRIGLVYLDGSSDLRHPGNSETVGAAAGEALALTSGRGQADVTTGKALYSDGDIVVLGIRDYDDHLAEMTAVGIAYRTAPDIRSRGASETADWVRSTLDHLHGYWLHLDVDVLDPSVLTAVDSPDPGGLLAEELVDLVTPIVADPRCLGVDYTIFDPDLDSDGSQTALAADLLVRSLTSRST